MQEVSRWFVPCSLQDAVVVNYDSRESVFFQALVLQVHNLAFGLF